MKFPLFLGNEPEDVAAALRSIEWPSVPLQNADRGIASAMGAWEQDPADAGASMALAQARETRAIVLRSIADRKRGS